MIRTETPKFYILNQTLVDPDLAMEKREIISENTYSGADGMNLFTLTFKQVLQDFGVRNWNGRNYSEQIVMESINSNPLIQHDLKMKTWTGEYGHPLIDKGTNELQRQMTIFPPNACWTIDKYWVEGNLLMGECTTLSGGYGDLVRNRILTGYPAMASSRAIGGVDKNGNVLRGYSPITFDCVIRPSHKVAYEVSGSEHINQFPLMTGKQNTMSECAIAVDPKTDQSFANFVLSESSTQRSINMLCDTFQLDYDTMQITDRNIIIESTSGLQRQKIIIPIRQMVAAEYWNLF